MGPTNFRDHIRRVPCADIQYLFGRKRERDAVNLVFNEPKQTSAWN